MVAHSCIPSTSGGQGGWITKSRDRDHPGQHRESPVSTKNTKISWASWCTPVVPATREAEAGELLEPRRQRLRWAEIMPLHSSLGNNIETPSQKKKKEKQKVSREKDAESDTACSTPKSPPVLSYTLAPLRFPWNVWLLPHIGQLKCIYSL